MEEFLKPKGAERANINQLYDGGYKNMAIVSSTANVALEEHHVIVNSVGMTPYDADYVYGEGGSAVFGRLCDIIRPNPKDIEKDLTTEYMNLWEVIAHDAVAMNKFDPGKSLWDRYVDKKAKNTTILLSAKAPASFKRALTNYLYSNKSSSTDVHFIEYGRGGSLAKKISKDLSLAEFVKEIKNAVANAGAHSTPDGVGATAPSGPPAKTGSKLAFVTWSSRVIYDAVVAFSAIDAGGAVHVTLRDLDTSIYTMIMLGSMVFKNVDISTSNFGVTLEFTVVFCDKIKMSMSSHIYDSLRELAEYNGADADAFTNMNLRGSMRVTRIDVILTAKLTAALTERYMVLLSMQKQLIRSSKAFMDHMHLRKWAMSELNEMFDNETAQRIIIRLEPSLWREAYGWDKHCM